MKGQAVSGLAAATEPMLPGVSSAGTDASGSAGVDPDSLGVMEFLQRVVQVASAPTDSRGAGGWMRVVKELSEGITALTAARDDAVVRLAAIDEVVTEDGLIGEQVNGLGTVSLDAAGMVSTAANVTPRFAEDIIDHAITRVVQVPALHEAMTTGALDEYRARCIGGELFDVPPDLARAVVDVLADEVATKSGPALRRRTRQILYKLCPELLSERLAKSRQKAYLRRRVGEPGLDSWSGWFPSDKAARAWAAVDALARRYRLDGTYPTLEQARAAALLDLVEGNATVETVLHLTVPADALDEAGADADTNDADASATDAADPTRSDASTGAAADSNGAETTSAAPEAAAQAGSTTGAQDNSAQENGAQDNSAAHQEPGHPGPSSDSLEDSAQAGSTSDAQENSAQENGAQAAPGRDRQEDSVRTQNEGAGSPASEAAGADTEVFVAVSGASGSEQSWVPLRSLTRGVVARLTGAAAAAAAGRVRTAHPETGALIDPENELATEAYRPSTRLQALIRARDGRCRFPGCAVAARQCDIDHVIAWPKGPTAASNLMCLCRRHHRIKQLHRWQVRLFADGTVEWTDPAGQHLTTRPVDHLGATHPRHSNVTTTTTTATKTANTAMPTSSPNSSLPSQTDPRLPSQFDLSQTGPRPPGVHHRDHSGAGAMPEFIDYHAMMAYESELLDLATSRGELQFGIGLEHEIATAAEWAFVHARRSTRALRRQQAKRPTSRPTAQQTRQRTQWWTRKVERAVRGGRCRYELYSPPTDRHILVDLDADEVSGTPEGSSPGALARAGDTRPLPRTALRGWGTRPAYDEPPF